MKVALTGIKPSGDVHLGNYLGMIRPALALQEKYAPFYFIADYHAITKAVDSEQLRDWSLDMAATFLAFGLDPQKAVLFRQSAVPEVCELTWILACQVSAGQLERGHAVKSARDGGGDITAGTMFYPLLMAADILMYNADIVPVGKDQKQHVEIARDIAIKVNYRYGADTLRVPEVSIKESVGVIPGLDGRKMSKSYQNVIPLWLTQKKLRKLIMKLKTDSLTVEEPKDPEVCNVFQLYRLFGTEKEIQVLKNRYRSGGMGYGEAKQALFEVIDAELAGPRERYQELRDNPAEIEAVLASGADRAKVVARETIERLRERVGLTPTLSGTMR